MAPGEWRVEWRGRRRMHAPNRRHHDTCFLAKFINLAHLWHENKEMTRARCGLFLLGQSAIFRSRFASLSSFVSGSCGMRAM